MIVRKCRRADRPANAILAEHCRMSNTHPTETRRLHQQSKTARRSPEDGAKEAVSRRGVGMRPSTCSVLREAYCREVDQDMKGMRQSSMC